MKNSKLKILPALGIALMFSTMTFAQNAPAFDKGDNTIGISIGAGGNRYSSVFSYGTNYSHVNLPAFALIYDHGFFGEVGPGTIGIGGIFGYQYSFLSDYDGYDANWTNIVFGARGTYHLTLLKDKNNHFDPYAGILAGVRFQTYKNTYYEKKQRSYDSSRVLPATGVFVGAKYNFTKKFGAFAELAYDVSIIRVGLNFNF